MKQYVEIEGSYFRTKEIEDVLPDILLQRIFVTIKGHQQEVVFETLDKYANALIKLRFATESNGKEKH